MIPPKGITRSIGGWEPGPTERRSNVPGRRTATKAGEKGTSDGSSPTESRRRVDRHSTHNEVRSRVEPRPQRSRRYSFVGHESRRRAHGDRSTRRPRYRGSEQRCFIRAVDTHLRRASGRLPPFTPADDSTATTDISPLEVLDSSEANVGDPTTPFVQVT